MTDRAHCAIPNNHLVEVSFKFLKGKKKFLEQKKVKEDEEQGCEEETEVSSFKNPKDFVTLYFGESEIYNPTCNSNTACFIAVFRQKYFFLNIKFF